MRHQAEQAEGRWMNSRETEQVKALQRQVSHVLAQQVKTSPLPAIQRHAEFAQHAVTLQRNAFSGQVVRAALSMIPAGERPALQRAVDEALQADALQRQRDEQALQLHSIQRQLADLDYQATQPILSRIQARRGVGNPLPAAIQRHLEQGLNHDLSRVRIHDDAEADKLAKGVNAIAFTTGTDIFFRSGKFNPNTRSGLELLAHEVTHTVQQSQGKVGSGIDPDAGLEQEARTIGRKLASKPMRLSSPSAKANLAPITVGHALQRQAAGGPSQALLKRLAQAISSGKVDEAMKIIRSLAKPDQTKALIEMMRQFRGQMGAQVAEGLQAMIDGLSSRIPEAIKKTVKKGTTVKSGPWNPPGKQPIPYYLGTSAHNAIAAYYTAAHAGQLVITNMTPMSKILGRSKSLLTAAENRLKPDIVNMDLRHLYEIKPRGAAGLAVSEAAMYLALFRKANVKMDLGPVNDPGTIGIVPAPGGHYAFQAIAPGAIVYDYRKGDYNPATAPAQAPATSPAVAPAPAPASRQPQSQPAASPGISIPLPTDPEFMQKMSQVTGLTGAALVIYLIISEGSRVIPVRNLVPIP